MIETALRRRSLLAISIKYILLINNNLKQPLSALYFKRWLFRLDFMISIGGFISI